MSYFFLGTLQLQDYYFLEQSVQFGKGLATSGDGSTLVVSAFTAPGGDYAGGAVYTFDDGGGYWNLRGSPMVGAYSSYLRRS